MDGNKDQAALTTFIIAFMSTFSAVSTNNSQPAVPDLPADGIHAA